MRRLTAILRGLPALWCLLIWMPAPGVADGNAAAGLRPALFADRAPLFEPGAPATRATRGASLFTQGAGGGLFAALPGRLDAPVRPGGGGPVARGLRDLIARAEAGAAGYDAVQLGARVKPPHPPTRMTLAQIQAWTEATPGQPHAIGRYQFIPPTLRHLTRRLDLPPHTRFSPAIQDRLADLLLDDAGLQEVTAGEMSQDVFMLNLAKIWAGFPVSSGRSYYHGIAGNKAVLSFEAYTRAVRSILNG